MKRIFLIAVSVMLMALPSSAKLKFGLRAGYNITSMSLSSEVFDASNKAGFYVGPTVKVGLPLGFDLDLSAVYDQREADTDIYNPFTGEANRIKHKTVAIPFNVRKGFGMGDKASVFIFAGPQYAFNVGDKNVLTDYSEFTWRSSEFSVNVGVGAMLLNHVEVKANYNIPCGKTAESSVADGIGNFKVGAWQIGLAYYF